MKLNCVWFLVISAFVSVKGIKVLGILPFGSKSHFTIGNSILQTLHKAGHEVTVISPFPQKKAQKNYTDIDLSSILDEFAKGLPNAFMLGDMGPMIMMTFLYKFGGDLVETCMNHPNTIKFIESKPKFDICIVENFNADGFFGIADHVDCILITYTTFGAVKWIDDMTSNQSPFSYVPHPFLGYTDHMTFVERFWNTIYYQFENVMYALYHLPNQKKLYKKYFPNARRSFDEMYRGSAILFLNNHVSSSSARPYLPNMIEIGGIHVGPAKPLSADLQNFLDSAKEGVVLFSMGSMIQAVNWPVEKREAFVKAFGKLKQKVLWKYENDTLPNKPDNVMISSWIPQRDILAHKNVKIFITHGGLLGTTEALVEGVPVIGIPVYGDQKMNMQKAVTRGYGINIDLEDVSEEKVSAALNELLTNPKYDENAKLISSRFTDRPMTPQQSVVYWTEYALRQKGAPHLRAAGNSLNYFEFHLIDVYLALFAIIFAVSFIIYKALRFACCRPKPTIKIKTN